MKNPRDRDLKGVERDLNKAVEYYTLASGKHEEAAEALARLSFQLAK